MRGGAEQDEFDVVIVGGRPAGVGLALRLGARGLRTLVIERATFPSPPSVPSCPLLHAAAMHLLDELGIEESAYSDESARVETLGFQFGAYFSAAMPLPSIHGRTWATGIDRCQFDQVLWSRLGRAPSVERWEACSFRAVLRDEGGRVGGIVCVGRDGVAREVRAKLVVGADGRFSPVARDVGAAVLEDHSIKVSTVFHARWEGLAPFAPGVVRAAAIFTSGRGTSVLFIPAPGGRMMVATHMRADRVDVGGDAEAFYLGVLDRYENVRRRIAGARRVSDVVGIKRIGNRFLQPAGDGWALVGDALHHKDPVDAQGIYDALLEGKLLDEAVGPALSRGEPLDEALATYSRAVRDATRPMFLTTVKRLDRELYDEPSAIVARTLLRWLMTDPEYQSRFMRLLSRDIDPEIWLPSSVVRGAVLRGIARDARALFSARS